MKFKHNIAAFAVLAAAAASSIDTASIQAAQTSPVAVCAVHHSDACIRVVQAYLQANHPSDAELVAVLNAIASALQTGNQSRRAFAHTLEALQLIAAAIDDPKLKGDAGELMTTLAEARPSAPSADTNIVFAGSGGFSQSSNHR